MNNKEPTILLMKNQEMPANLAESGISILCKSNKHLCARHMEVSIRLLLHYTNKS